MPNREDGTPQFQAGGCVVLFTGYVDDSVDDVVGLLQKSEDVEAVIARLTERRDELQAMAYARLQLLRDATRRQHLALLQVPRDVAKAIGGVFRRHGGRDVSGADLRRMVREGRAKENAALAVNQSAA